MIPILETDRLLLRSWKAEDRQPFAELNADTGVMEHFPNLLSRAESDAMVDRIEASFDSHGFGLWAVERIDNGSFIGFVGLAVPTFEADFLPGVEVGWRLARIAWGHGFATEAASAALDDGFRRCELDEILSFTATLNRRSERVMERLGMSPSGEFDHPKLAEGDPLRRHVLYRLSQKEWFS